MAQPDAIEQQNLRAIMGDDAYYESQRDGTLPTTSTPSTAIRATPVDNAGIPQFSGKSQASDTWAYITRSMWEDYTKRFWPLEDELFKQTTYENPALVGEEIAEGKRTATTAINASLARQQQAIGGYGVTISKDQRAVNDRLSTLSRSSSLVDAANRIRDRLLDRNRQIAVGSSTRALEG